MNTIEDARTIPALVAAAAQAYGDHPAVVENGVTTSYRELADLVGRAARAYLALGVQHGDRVAIWVPNRVEYIVAMLGAQSVGAAVVPLNTRYLGHEALTILDRSRARALVVADGFLGKDLTVMLREAAAEQAGQSDRPIDATDPVPGLPTLRAVVNLREPTADDLGWTQFLAGGDAVPVERARAAAEAVSPDDICDLLFTSGTTGVPKGVMTAHRQTIRTAWVWGRGANLTPADRYLIVNPFFHGFGYKAGMITCIINGTTMYPVPSFDVDQVLDLIDRERISVLTGAPTIFTSLLDHPRLGEHDLSSLRFAIAGAANVPEALFADMLNVLGFKQVAQAYGLTECVVATQSRPNEDPAHVAETTGPAVPGIELRVVDADGRDVPVGQDGEILLRGDQVMLGYFEDPEGTRAAIDEDGWLHTGDIGRLDEHGCLKITDRIKDMFTVGGFNVYPAEVERVIGAHPLVIESAVVGIPDTRMGSVGRAYVAARRGATLSEQDVIDWCRARLANFKVPREVVIISEFPRNASGKIVKARLLDPQS